MALAATVSGLLTAATASPTVAATSTNNVNAWAAKASLARWHETIKHLPPPAEGCFHAAYPSVIWRKIGCGAKPTYRSTTRWKRVYTADGMKMIPDTAGGGNDYAAQTANTTISAVGSFPQVQGVTSESGVNVPFGGSESNGIIGLNQYTLQLNTDINASSAACANFGYQSCQVWVQFIYSTNNNGNITPAQPQVFIQNWVFPSQNDYAASGCPNGWIDASNANAGQYQCFVNSQGTNVPAVDATQLGSLKLSGTSSANGNDTATFTYGTDAYSASEPDSTNDLSAWWSQSEFNVVGNAGGSEAQFNSGSSITVNVAVEDGTTNAPSCLSSAGTTGETNNLSLGSCAASQGSSDGTAPSIQFTESN
ncbi:hypothetical protein EKH80_04340 [Dyella choica]|uniref:Secreted protein n=1 Tax=Dyella choica TaxID=1927959 RepID=A0A432MA64_9GAMM|nr:hypothetical protein EKH80_04340 [Dyella choica]